MPNQSFASRQPRVTASPCTDRDRPVLRLRLLNTGAVPVVEVHGDLDMSTTHLLVDLIDEFVAIEAPPLLMLDLGQLDFFGAHGITALLHIRQALLSRRGHLILRDPPTLTRTILALTEVIDVFDIQGGAEIIPT